LPVFLSVKQDKFKQFFDLIVNESFRNYLHRNPWLAYTLIVVLSLSVILRLASFINHIGSGMSTNDWMHETEDSFFKRISNINESYDCHNITCCNMVDKISSKLRNGKVVGRLKFLDFCELLVKKCVRWSIFLLISVSLIECLSKCDSRLGFNLVPEFIEKSKSLLICSTVLFSIVFCFCIYNSFVNIMNVFNIGSVSDNYLRPSEELLLDFIVSPSNVFNATSY
jgi:hypothetical protein